MGAGSALLCSLAGSAILAYLIQKESVAYDAMGYGIMMILLGSSLAGSYLAWRKIKHRRAAVCLATGGTFFLMLLSITALFFGGQFEAVGVTALLIFSGSASVILAGLGQGRADRHRVRKKPR